VERDAGLCRGFHGAARCCHRVVCPPTAFFFLSTVGFYLTARVNEKAERRGRGQECRKDARLFVRPVTASPLHDSRLYVIDFFFPLCDVRAAVA
jgi:hypothetical protein